MTECNEKSNCTEWQMCPFHSDYLPPTAFILETPYEEDGKKKAYSEILEYGCDLYTLNRFAPVLGEAAGDSALKSYTKLGEIWSAEYGNMYRALEKRDAIVSKASSIRDRTINLREWLGRQCSRRLIYFGKISLPADMEEAKERHRIRIGCNGEDGDVIIPLPEEPPAPEEGDIDEYDPNIDYQPSDWPYGLIRFELRGPFSLGKNELGLMRDYDALRTSWGENRELWVEVTNNRKEWADRLFDPIKSYIVDLYFANWDPHQEQMEGTMIPKASDAGAQVVHELQPARSAIGELSRTANSLRGVRGFARSFAYFLRRSCIFRPCNDRLDQILKVVFSDACFPYTDGEYLTDPEIIEACKNEVEQK